MKEKLKHSSQETGETKGRSDPPVTSPHNEPQESSFNLQPPAPAPGDCHVASMLNRDLLVAVKKSGQYTNLVAIKTLEAE